VSRAQMAAAAVPCSATLYCMRWSFLRAPFEGHGAGEKGQEGGAGSSSRHGARETPPYLNAFFLYLPICCTAASCQARSFPLVCLGSPCLCIG